MWSIKLSLYQLLPNLWILSWFYLTILHYLSYSYENDYKRYIAIHINFTLQYVECPAGCYGDNCSDVCPAPHYGIPCFQKCDCLSCHHVYGCSPTLTKGKAVSVPVKDYIIRLRLDLYLLFIKFIFYWLQ